MATVKENLIAARALIDTPEKWGKGADRMCHCVLDAVDAVQGTFGDLVAADFLAQFLPEAYRHDPSNWNHPVAQFNDDPATIHDDVIDLLDRAIAACDEVKP